MAISLGLICVGCGKNLDRLAKTRKKLGEDSKASDRETTAIVLSTWREIAANTPGLQQYSQLDGSTLKMCASCFKGYAKLGRLKSTIKAKIDSVVEQLSDVDVSVPSPKRPKIDDSTYAASSTSVSPSVMVRLLTVISCSSLFTLK